MPRQVLILEILTLTPWLLIHYWSILNLKSYELTIHVQNNGQRWIGNYFRTTISYATDLRSLNISEMDILYYVSSSIYCQCRSCYHHTCHHMTSKSFLNCSRSNDLHQNKHRGGKQDTYLYKSWIWFFMFWVIVEFCCISQVAIN